MELTAKQYRHLANGEWGEIGKKAALLREALSPTSVSGLLRAMMIRDDTRVKKESAKVTLLLDDLNQSYRTYRKWETMARQMGSY